MSLLQTYLDDNGYDYYGNAAEDTLLFFVRDEDAPTAGEAGGKDSGSITNGSDDTVNGVPGKLSSETTATNTETHAEAYRESGKDTSNNFSIARDNATADNEYNDAPMSGAATTDTNSDNNDVGDSVPKMAEMDPEQTDTEHSTDAEFKA